MKNHPIKRCSCPGIFMKESSESCERTMGLEIWSWNNGWIHDGYRPNPAFRQSPRDGPPLSVRGVLFPEVCQLPAPMVDESSTTTSLGPSKLAPCTKLRCDNMSGHGSALRIRVIMDRLNVLHQGQDTANIRHEMLRDAISPILSIKWVRDKDMV